MHMPTYALLTYAWAKLELLQCMGIANVDRDVMTACSRRPAGSMQTVSLTLTKISENNIPQLVILIQLLTFLLCAVLARNDCTSTALINKEQLLFSHPFLSVGYQI